MKKKLLKFPKTSYYQNEAWFLICKLKKGKLRGFKIINSYGCVREIWEDGTYKELYSGKDISE